MAAAHETGFALSGSQRIFWRRFGRPGRLPVVIVHGLSYFSFDWIDVATRLAEEREVVAIDMRGFGESDWSPDKDYSPAANARDIIAVLEHFRWQAAILVGHSMGGRHCTYCAAKYPDRVAALVSVDFAPSIASQGAARVADIVGNTPDAFASVEAAVAYYSKDPHSPKDARVLGRFEQYLRPVEAGLQVKRDPYFRDYFRRILDTGQRPAPAIDMWSVLEEVSCPTLFIRGTRSDMFTSDIMVRLRKSAPLARIVEIEAAHHIAGDAPEALIGAIKQFVSFLPRQYQ